MNAFSECLSITKYLAFPFKQIETYNSLAELQSNYKIAKEYLETGRKICIATSLNSLELGKSFYIEAGLLLLEEKYDKAIGCIDHAIEILEQVGYGSGCAKSYLIKGKILFQSRQYKSAIEYLEKAGKYYIREEIYPTLRLESFYYILKCAEEIGQLNQYKKFDDYTYFNEDQFPHLQKYLKEIKCKI